VEPTPNLASSTLIERAAAALEHGVQMRTSGSVGHGRLVTLSGAALRASAEATHARLGGPGRWVLALPPQHIAGFQVTVRAALAANVGMPDALMAAPTGSKVTSAIFAHLLERALADDAPVYLSLVPTQLQTAFTAARQGCHDTLALPSAAENTLSLLARCKAVLLGGAATPPALLRQAIERGINVIRTYGMTETAGGCVYDGAPLTGVRLRIAEGGLVELAGPMLADGYLGDAATTNAAFHTDADGVRWFRTSDLGRIDQAGVLSVHGRADTVVITGGVNVAPEPVEAELLGLPLLATEVAVVGVPDERWGQAVVAVFAKPEGTDGLTPVSPELLALVRRQITDSLGPPSAPHRIYVTNALPRTTLGKLDRPALINAILRLSITNQAPNG